MMLLTSLFGSAACSSEASSPEATNNGDGETATNFAIQYTTPVPSEFFQAATQQGAIELVEYESKDYTSSSRPTTHKPAYVYVPYGYDPSQKYEVNSKLSALLLLFGKQ